MGTQTAASHNPSARASGKRAIPLAAKVAREIGMIPTWPNLQTIRIAIESEAEYFRVALVEVAEMFICAGRESTPIPQLHCPAQWERREISQFNTVNRFWFEDARWRVKFAYIEFLEKHEQTALRATNCQLHPGSRVTQSGACWECYATKYESGCQPA